MVEVDGAYKITKDPTYYECIKCKSHWKEHQKSEFMKEEGFGGKAKWIATKKPDRPRMRSYHLNALYSPVGFLSWLDIAIMWNRVKDDPLALQDFINDVLGETSKEQQEAPKMHELMRYAEDWDSGHINSKVIMLTLTADIQLDRIEAGLVGWGKDKEAWFIDYWTFKGDTREIESDCWLRLAEKIQADYIRADGINIDVQVALIDSQYNKEQVNAFCSNNFSHVANSVKGVYPVISRDRLQGQTTKIGKNDIDAPVVIISDQDFKSALYKTLRKRPHKDGVFPFGYMHFPKTFREDFYKQLTSEEVFEQRLKNGKKKITIENRKQKRNEVFDIAKYNIAAFTFAINRYFELENQHRKKNHKKEIQVDTHHFFKVLEDSLYNQ
jgi:phage terminase large subunit GpA-like protein